MSPPDALTGPASPGGDRRSLLVGLALVAALAVATAVVASTSSLGVTTAGPVASSPGPPCTDRSGVCLPPDVCPPPAHPYSADELDRIRSGVESIIDNSYYSVGNGQHAVGVDLFPGHEDMAAELERRFGDAVTIRMGTTRYCGGPGRSGRCADAQGATTLPPGLALSLTLEHRTVARTADAAKGSLTVRYDGPGTFDLGPGQPIEAHIVKPGTRSVIGTFTGLIAGTGLSVHLASGEQQTIDVLIGTARCDGGLGSALPPGTYGVLAPLGPDGGPPDYLAPEVQLTIR